MNKRSIIVRGCPHISEEGVAASEVRPGFLVKQPASGVAHQTATSIVPKALAIERDELGRGIDNTYQAATSAYYVSGDQVKVATFASGDRAVGYVASGENIQQDELLESAGDGTFKAATVATAAIARSTEEVGAVTELTAIVVEFL